MSMRPMRPVLLARVTMGTLPPRSDVLIGMDLISQGDFSVTNKGGSTVFSFRVPSQVHTDYVKEHNSRPGCGFGGGPMPPSPPRAKRHK